MRHQGQHREDSTAPSETPGGSTEEDSTAPVSHQGAAQRGLYCPQGAGLGPRPEGGRAGAGWKLKLKEQQKIHEEAFKHDMQRYLSRGYLSPAAPGGGSDRELAWERRPGLCSGSLDQLLVSDMSDLEAFDDFLSSSANDARSSTSSLTSG
ncbi:unnamed protein product [Arctogadus glacialis]